MFYQTIQGAYRNTGTFGLMAGYLVRNTEGRYAIIGAGEHHAPTGLRVGDAVPGKTWTVVRSF